MQNLLGVLSLVAAVVGLAMHLRTSYLTQGGRLGQDPCIAAAAIQVPMMTMLGLVLLSNGTGRFDFPWWLWLLLWLAETVAVGAVANWVGNLAHRRAAGGPGRE